jgi:hypothetical protein
MRQPAVIYLKSSVRKLKNMVLTRLMKRLGSSCMSRVLFKACPIAEKDPYLLILLAAREFDEGHQERAICLVEAAYDAFDQRKNVTRLRTAGRTVVPANSAFVLSLV